MVATSVEDIISIIRSL